MYTLEDFNDDAKSQLAVLNAIWLPMEIKFEEICIFRNVW